MMSCIMTSPLSCIILVATSSEAIMLYCGEVEPCIMYDSLNSAGSILTVPPFRICSMEACEKAVSSLWVDCEQKIGGSSGFTGPSAMP